MHFRVSFKISGNTCLFGCLCACLFSCTVRGLKHIRVVIYEIIHSQSHYHLTTNREEMDHPPDVSKWSSQLDDMKDDDEEVDEPMGGIETPPYNHPDLVNTLLAQAKEAEAETEYKHTHLHYITCLLHYMTLHAYITYVTLHTGEIYRPLRAKCCRQVR